MIATMKKFIGIFAIFQLYPTITEALYTKIEPYSNECFFERLEKGDTLKFSYEVTQGGFLDVDLIIYDPNGNILRRVNHQTRDTFIYNVVLEGVYNCCMGNGMSSVTSKVVHFVFMIEKQHPPIEQENMTEKDLHRLLSGLQTVRLHQWNMIARSRVHNEINENTNVRVVHWTYVQLIFSASVTFLQFWYLKKLFDVHYIV